MRRASLLTLLLTMNTWGASLVRLGEPLPAHPWADAERQVVVIYSHDCGDLGELWSAALEAGLPVQAINVGDVASPAPGGVSVWRGAEANAFARTLRVQRYPTVLLVRHGKVLNAWQGNFQADSLERYKR